MKTCVVVGVGPGNGESLTRTFGEGGYQVAMLTRTEQTLRDYEQKFDFASGYACDVTDADTLTATLHQVAEEMDGIDVLVWNAGSGVWGGLEEVDPADFEQTWRVNTLGLFNAAKAVVPAMADNGGGALAVIGAGAAWRGRPNTVAFAAAKASQRSVAQSVAREYGAKGVHVSYCVIDGVIDIPATRERMSDKPDEFFLKPDDIAQTVYDVCHQPRSAWTFEYDVRPFVEDW